MKGVFKMKFRLKITVLAVIILLIGLVSTPLLASTVYSTATVNYGSTSWVTGGSQSLYDTAIYGTVRSTYATGTADQRLLGEMWTKGVIFSVKRDFMYVNPNGSGSLYWSNPNGETGSFFSKGYAQYGNHDGFCQVYQSGH